MDIKQNNYEVMKEAFETRELKLGPWTSYSMANDARHMAFVLSRYKFVAKMLEGRSRIMEVGCGDAFGLPIVAQILPPPSICTQLIGRKNFWKITEKECSFVRM